MKPMCLPLRYKISSWYQLPQCLSNNDPKLHLTATKFIQNTDISGIQISVIHDVYGTLFSYIIRPEGHLVSNLEDVSYPELSTNEILAQLAKFGFLIVYEPWKSLSGDQIQYLMTLKQLNFDKLRILSIWKPHLGIKKFKTVVVAFQVQCLPDWLNAGYSPFYKQFDKAINNGTAINISAISESHKYDWSWLYNWVADIDDILADCAIVQ